MGASEVAELLQRRHGRLGEGCKSMQAELWPDNEELLAEMTEALSVLDSEVARFKADAEIQAVDAEAAAAEKKRAAKKQARTMRQYLQAAKEEYDPDASNVAEVLAERCEDLRPNLILPDNEKLFGQIEKLLAW